MPCLLQSWSVILSKCPVTCTLFFLFIGWMHLARFMLSSLHPSFKPFFHTQDVPWIKPMVSVCKESILTRDKINRQTSHFPWRSDYKTIMHTLIQSSMLFWHTILPRHSLSYCTTHQPCGSVYFGTSCNTTPSIVKNQTYFWNNERLSTRVFEFTIRSKLIIPLSNLSPMWICIFWHIHAAPHVNHQEPLISKNQFYPLNDGSIDAKLQDRHPSSDLT